MLPKEHPPSDGKRSRDRVSPFTPKQNKCRTATRWSRVDVVSAVATQGRDVNISENEVVCLRGGRRAIYSACQRRDGRLNDLQLTGESMVDSRRSTYWTQIREVLWCMLNVRAQRL
jgi:hypothetical protein